MLKNEKKRKMEQNYKVFLLETKNKYFSFDVYNKVIGFLTAEGEGIFEIKRACKY